MNYRELEIGEVIQKGDEWDSSDDDDGSSFEKVLTTIGESYDPRQRGRTMFHTPHRRPLPEPTFDESANFDVVPSVSHEAVSDCEISQHSADEVIYATGQDKPQEWDGEVLNNKFGKTAAYEKYKMLFKGEFCLVYTSESHIECSGRVDECNFRPIKSVRQVAIDEALEVFTGMISPSENQLGVLYDAGYLLPKKDD